MSRRYRLYREHKFVSIEVSDLDRDSTVTVNNEN